MKVMDHSKNTYHHRHHESTVTLFPEQSGTYALIMRVPKLKKIKIGALGEYHIKPGSYTYIGSAFGPGGLRGRLRHHVLKKASAKSHWHIDYLRSIASIAEIWWTNDAIKREHDWALIFREQMNMETPITGFGSSDCTCISHLFYSHNNPNIRRFSRLVHSHWNDHALIHSVIHSTK